MKPNIHPEYKEIKVSCSCGSVFVTRSTAGKDLSLEVCAKCHPFYTGTQKMVDTAGRVDRFRQKYGMRGKEAKEAKEPVKAEAKEVKHEIKEPKEAKAPAKETKPAKEPKAAKEAKTAKSSKAASDKKK